MSRLKCHLPIPLPAQASHGVASVEEYIINARGVVLFTKEWLPGDGRLKGVVVGCHGYGETCTYIFEDVAVQLAGKGYMRAMGCQPAAMATSTASPALWMTWLKSPAVQKLFSVHTPPCPPLASPRFGHLPFFVYGESMGGAVAIQVAKELTLPAPLIFPFSCFARIFPTWKLLPVSGKLDKCFKVPEKRERANNHSFAYHDRLRLGTSLQIYQTTLDICAHMEEVTVPLLILQGTEDKVIDMAAVRDLFF
ncbi:unnamed protein product [Closterium sp. Naga37s-1]|nr:unnamed protein product [Closterium sp. Naga37s-1]